MNERHIYLIERNLSGDAEAKEVDELNNLMKNDPELKADFEEQKRIKEILNTMKMKNPSSEIWDRYWIGIYNRIERGLAWILISIGIIIMMGYGSIELIDNLIKDNQIPSLLKFGIGAAVFGLVILIYSTIREKFYISKNDRYKGIQR